uniref:MFP1 attachment factor 1-like n=1 Tax=Erigeron canadensis TaxID=72917 RepID=UPI001CB93869|nr:MFP1 attachment factor 1-like [Erigeron canadensis]
MSGSRKQDPSSIIAEEMAKVFGTKSSRKWPPTKSTRDATIKRVIKCLSETFQIPATEADVIVRRIEEEAFTAAGSSSAPAARIYDVYTQEFHNRITEYSRKIWPPPRGMRDAVVRGLITAFSAILQMPTAKADVIIRQVEEEAFNVISASSGVAAGEDGMALYMAYYKEMNNRMFGKLFPK